MQNSKPSVATPTLKRRLICLVYESFLVAAVVALAATIFIVATQKLPPGPIKVYGLRIVIFIAAGAYFVHSWTGSGFTLAMKTWRIKLVMVGHARVPITAAVVRYVLAWGWVAPAAIAYTLLNLHKPMAMVATFTIGVLAWALTAFLDKDRQFLHDRLAGTRLISLPKPVKLPKTSPKA
jgi:uncharacterized RDD family membrane protein YckC